MFIHLSSPHLLPFSQKVPSRPATQKVPMDLRSRYYAIQQKEADLKQRESSLRNQNVAISSEKAPNFPPCWPVLYHNIAEEIPIHSQWFIRLCLINIIAFVVLAPLNFLACCTSGQFSDGVAQNVVFSIIVGLLTAPLAFRITYKKLYGQCKADEFSLWALGLKALLFAWIVIGAAGIEKSGMAGIAMAVDAFANRDASGFARTVVVLTAAIYVAAAALEFFLLGRLLILFKSTGQRIDTFKETKYSQMQ
jgi:hypothetical protein